MGWSINRALQQLLLTLGTLGSGQLKQREAGGGLGLRCCSGGRRWLRCINRGLAEILHSLYRFLGWGCSCRGKLRLGNRGLRGRRFRLDRLFWLNRLFR